uniref:OSJNBb0089K06.16 protein n=1 Tax=Oryza sativa subsp. japonica TaxID=39947 RepID=Q7XNZ4_ORYSJ|nr:OSJNBb0089K06.16 [Oryza sativa Japonica Group]
MEKEALGEIEVNLTGWEAEVIVASSTRVMERTRRQRRIEKISRRGRKEGVRRGNFNDIGRKYSLRP